jgi:hypothetical protein
MKASPTNILVVVAVCAILAMFGYALGGANLDEKKRSGSYASFWVLLTFVIAWFVNGTMLVWHTFGERGGPGWGGPALIWIYWVVVFSPSAFALGCFAAMRPKPFRLHVVDLVGIVIGISVVLAAVVYFRK